MNINWFGFPDVLIIAGAAILIMGIVGTAQRWRKGFPMLGFKEWVDGVKTTVAVLWVVSMMMLFVLSVASVVEWMDTFAKAATSESSYWVLYYLVPQTYVLTGFTLLVYTLVRLFKWRPLKYNSKEQAFLDEDKKRWKAKLGRFGFLIKIKET